MVQKLLLFFITTLFSASFVYAGNQSPSYRPGDTVRVVVTSNNTADECSLVVYDPDFDRNQGSVLPYHSGGGTVFTWTGYWVVPAIPEFGDWSGITVLWDTVGVNTRVGGGNTVWSVTDTFLIVTTVLDKAEYALTAGERTNIANRVLQDSSKYQAKTVSLAGGEVDKIAYAVEGSLSIPTVGEIADGVWDETQSGHVGAGSFGAYIDAKISDMGVILGSKPVRAYLLDAADSTILGNVEVQLYNKNDTTYSDLIYVSYTNTSGWIDLNLDTLTYWLRWEHPQYVASTDSFTVADDDTLQGFIFYATAFSPPSPSVDSTCVVWGRLRKATGEYAADIKVQFILEPSDPAFYMEKLLDRRKVETMTDSIGFWSVAVYPNSRITPLGTGYKVKIWGDPIIEETYIVPADTSAAFNSLERWDD